MRSYIGMAAVPFFLWIAGCNPFADQRPKPPTIRGVSAALTSDQIRKMEGWEEQVWTSTPYGVMPYFWYSPKNSENEYFSIIKTSLGDTLQFSWKFKLPENITMDQAMEDVIGEFSAYGDAFIERSSYVMPLGLRNSNIYIIYNCSNCAEIEKPHCSHSAIEVEMCIVINAYGREKTITGLWYNASASDAEDKWIEQHREKIRF